MQAIKLRGHVGPGGLLKLELHVDAANQDVEAIVVIEVPVPHTDADLDEYGYPSSFFERLDQIPGEIITERSEQGRNEPRDTLE